MLSIFSKRKIQIEVQLSDIFTIFWVFFSLNWNTTFSIIIYPENTRFLYKSIILWPSLYIHHFSYGVCYSAIVTYSYHCSIVLTKQLFSILTIPFMIYITIMILYVLSIDSDTRILIEKKIVEWDKQIKVKRTQKQICKVIL